VNEAATQGKPAVQLTQTATNQTKVARAQAAWDELLAEVLRRNFFGTAAIEISVQDGTIQHFKCRVERIER
jgi:hypothetical protein